ncbi:MAG: hypothetical protein WBH47_13005 [Streptosporangiaceae bacterium]
MLRHPLLANALHDAADPGLPAAMLDLAARLPQIRDVLDGLPQTHAHGDASPHYLLLPAGEPGTVVVIDWGSEPCCLLASISASNSSALRSPDRPTPPTSRPSTPSSCQAILRD